MTFFSILFALIAEQYKPVEKDHWVRRLSHAWLDFIVRNIDTGADRSGRLACLAAFIPPVVLVLAVHIILLATQPFLAFLWNIFIVYLFLGFRQFSHPFTAIHEALLDRDLDTARQVLAEWQGAGVNTETMSESEVIRLALEQAIIGAHRHVFAPIFWFMLPFGPAGVVLYRLVDMAATRWPSQASASMGRAARSLFQIIDWIPVRLTAIGFAIVGNFEDAIYGWRYHLRKWSNELDAVILAAGAGALGVRLGSPLPEPDSDEALRMAEAGEPPIYDLGQEASVRSLRSAVGLVWRAVILWLTLILLMTISVWLG
jgi:adenosylcobinamide-phosphate synthase